MLDGLYDALGYKKLESDGMRIWYMALCDLTEEQLAFAIGQYVVGAAQQRLSPMVIRELSGVQQSREAEAVKAWSEALRAISTVGAYASPVFSSAAIAETIRHLGGWVWFCDQAPDELRRWTRQHFLKTFASLQRLDCKNEPLKNLCDASNALSGMTDVAIGLTSRGVSDAESLSRYEPEFNSGLSI